ncbi:MAG: HAMP domain-containing sensor histidine kinase [Anaerolineaceae bacterium]|nr:HAMP domain-containing sensor histidine kinase [Anaerolineaceae bacterium]
MNEGRGSGAGAAVSWRDGWLALLSEPVDRQDLRRLLAAVQRHSGASQVHLQLVDETLADCTFCEGTLCCSRHPPAVPEGLLALRFPLQVGECALAELVLYFAAGRTAAPEMTEFVQGLAGWLRVAQADCLRESLRAREEWLQILIHDLRSPLATLRAYLDLLLEGRPAGGETAEYLAAIQRSAQQQEDLLSQMMSLYEVDRGQDQGRPMPIPIHTFLEEVLAEHRDAAELAGLWLESRLGVRAELQLVAEEALLRRALSNLLGNAIRYTPAGGTVLLEAGQGGGQLWLRIRDDGPGVPAAIRERIFQPFARSPVAGVAAGTGLGLAFTQAAAGRLGGELSLEETETGSAFVMKLPLAGVGDSG